MPSCLSASVYALLTYRRADVASFAEARCAASARRRRRPAGLRAGSGSVDRVESASFFFSASASRRATLASASLISSSLACASLPPYCRASSFPTSLYISESAFASEPSGSIAPDPSSSRAAPSASSCAPSAASPNANCATFVRSRQSTQCDRRTPRCVAAASASDARHGGVATATAPGSHGLDPRPAPGRVARGSPPPRVADGAAKSKTSAPSSRPVNASHRASRQSAAHRRAADEASDDRGVDGSDEGRSDDGSDLSARSSRVARRSNAARRRDRGAIAKTPTRDTAPAATRVSPASPLVSGGRARSGRAEAGRRGPLPILGCFPTLDALLGVLGEIPVRARDAFSRILGRVSGVAPPQVPVDAMQRRRELVPERGLLARAPPVPLLALQQAQDDRRRAEPPVVSLEVLRRRAEVRVVAAERDARPRVQRARRVLRPPKRNAPARLRHRGERDRGGARGTPPTRTVHHLFRLHLVRDVARASDPAAVKPRPGEVARPPRDEDDVERAPKQREPPRREVAVHQRNQPPGERGRAEGAAEGAREGARSTRTCRRNRRRRVRSPRGVRRRRRSWPASSRRGGTRARRRTRGRGPRASEAPQAALVALGGGPRAPREGSATRTNSAAATPKTSRPQIRPRRRRRVTTTRWWPPRRRRTPRRAHPRATSLAPPDAALPAAIAATTRRR